MRTLTKTSISFGAWAVISAALLLFGPPAPKVLHGQGAFFFGSNVAVGGAAITWTHVQGHGDDGYDAGMTSIKAPLPVDPTSGNAVVVAWWDSNNFTGSAATCTVADSNANAYTKTASTPVGVAAQGFLYIFYLLNAPANATKTLTLSCDANITYNNVYAQEAHRSTGTATLDSQTTDTGTAGGAGTVTSPTITVTGNTDFLFSALINNSHNPGAASPWIANADNATNTYAAYCVAEYHLDVAASLAVSFTLGNGFDWNTAGISLK